MAFDMYGTVIEVLIIGAVAILAFALLDHARRRRAKVRDGWRYLTPGPMMWTAFAGSAGFSGLMGYIYLFVGSARTDATSQMTMALILAVIFNLAAIVLAYSMIVQELRWNDTHIQSRNWLFRTYAMTWHQLAMVGYNPLGYWWIRAYDGPKIRFSPDHNGVPELLANILENLPPDLPPAEAEMVQQAVLARAP